MTVLQITCDNCGAKYKLPETFTGTQAKCQKCGSVIDVQKQRAAAAAPAAATTPAAAAKPAAAARPAIDRSKAAPKEAPVAAARPERASRRGKDADAEDATGGRRGRGERPAKKSNQMPLILGGVGLVAIAIVAVLMFSGDGKTTSDTAAKNEPTTPQPTPPPAPAPEAPKVEPAKVETPAAQPAPQPAAPPAATPTDASATPPPAATPPATPDDPSQPKRPWQKLRNPPATMADVSDAKTYGEVKWPEGIDDAKKSEVRALAADAAGDGIRSVRAKKQLEGLGFVALFGIVEELQKLDYKSAEQSMIAFDLNKLLDQITAGLNAQFEPVEASEELVPAKAEWNTRTVKGWMTLVAGFADEAAYLKGRAERVKKAAEK